MKFNFIKNLTYGDRIARLFIGAILVDLVGFKILPGLWAVGTILLALGLFLEAAFAY